MTAAQTVEEDRTVALVVSEINGPFEVKDVRLKEMYPDEIIVKMVATGVCHTDVLTANVSQPFLRLLSLLVIIYPRQ